MKKYYGVIYILYNNETSNHFIHSQEAASKPEDGFKDTFFGEMWINWFDTKKDAERYILEL